MAIDVRHGKGGDRFRVIYRGTDKQQHTAGTFATRKEAERAYDMAMHRVALGIDAPAVKPTPLYEGENRHGVTLAGYWEGWLGKHPVGDHAKENYAGIIRATLLPALGGTALADIDVATVKALFRDMEAADASAAALAKVKTVLSALLQTAAEDPRLPVAFNPVRGVSAPDLEVERRVVRGVHAAEAFEGQDYR